MFTDIKKALDYIEHKRNKHTLDEFRDILRDLGINMAQPHMIHIAGTNGKGSTVNYLRAILNANGYKVGTFTSPYLTCHNDRIRIDDEPISDDDLLALINKYEDVIEKEDLSMFEIDVLIMLDYFDHQELDYRIIECGIGGANDKTNVIDSELSAITNIGNDHLDLIGPSLYDVINEKMGIIKPHQIFVTSETSGTIIARLQEQCDVMNAMMVVVPEYDVDVYPYDFSYRNMHFILRDQGIYQIMNARLALTIAFKLIDLDPQKTQEAVESARWGGRYETFEKDGVKITLDGAHNVPAISSLIDTLSNESDVGIVFSCLKDKKIDEMLALLKKAELDVYLTSFEDERQLDLSSYHQHELLKVEPDYHQAIALACATHQHVVVCGSLHFVSIVRQELTKMNQGV